MYLVNVKSEEILQYYELHKKIKAYSKLTSIPKVAKNSILIIEDIISLKNDEEACLRQYLNYVAHHESIKIFCVSHTIYKTKIFSTVSLFHYIVFTSSLQNLVVLKQTLQSFKIDKHLVKKWTSVFEKYAEGDKFKAYYFFDCSKMIFYRGKTSGSAQTASCFNSVSAIGSLTEAPSQLSDKTESNEKMLKKHFEDIVRFHPYKTQANSLFSIIVKALPKQHIRCNDLTVTFKLKNKRNLEKSISLVDYIHALLSTTKKGAPVDTELRVLHEFIRRRCKIPKIFILNSNFESQTAIRR